MSRPLPFRSLGLALLLLLPVPPLALLCRGRTPTRFEARNLPAWERRSFAQHHPRRDQHRNNIRATLKRRKEAAFGECLFSALPILRFAYSIRVAGGFEAVSVRRSRTASSDGLLPKRRLNSRLNCEALS